MLPFDPSENVINDKYEIINQIGCGAYASVYKARTKTTGKLVAIKQLKSEKDQGFPVTSLREIQLLQEIHHPNIIQLIEVLHANDFIERNTTISLVFEFMPHDLSSFLKCEEIVNKVGVGQLKGYMLQILQAIQFLHSNNILHRDIKTGNILISDDNHIKLGDFGLARKQDDVGIYTNNMVTLWYRPPELLLGETRYKGEVDMWSVGCVFLEIFKHRPVFHGKTENEQLSKIWEICGTPTDSQWPQFREMKMFQTLALPTPQKRILKDVFKGYDPIFMDLIDHLLQLNPKSRFTAEEALQHTYFTREPQPLKPEEMTKFDPSLESCYLKIQKEKQFDRSNSRERRDDRMNRRRQEDDFRYQKGGKRVNSFNNRRRTDYSKRDNWRGRRNSTEKFY
ncbi:cyclin-dependent kinase C-2, putative [Entamoeba dispar SAW760]|uniref:Cyclin-dependent kinase C-2, putative n=1 Tax=Entamoeba dispar (strain ATCC PRA-260 / SAW760) TaxID=370354 RepID=B0ENB4_ENTDS|nr:cyclin-dependent kinase C-2, putative [Entamoeba dispar SAW760]EDR23991.1 cyclin-dependent kinase C-2, putative [Entamoeba dispar SAW760]|eukprot:EDR23991.1 cyclin-dependent kinase C-2, putative [Entamoeba dispar SAW760]